MPDFAILAKHRLDRGSALVHQHDCVGLDQLFVRAGNTNDDSRILRPRLMQRLADGFDGLIAALGVFVSGLGLFVSRDKA